MSMEISNAQGSLGQFSSNRGYADLIDATRHVPELRLFFAEASADNSVEISKIADALRILKAPKDVLDTARGLADMIDGEETVYITDGTHDDSVGKYGDDEFDNEDRDEEPLEPEDAYEGADKRDVIELRGNVIKLEGDAHKRLVFGFFSVISINGKAIEDTQGDMITPHTLEDAAYEFVLYARTGGEMHQSDADGEVRGIGRLVESVVFTDEKQRAMLSCLHAQGITDAVLDLGCVCWWGGFYVDDPDTWAKVVSGELKAFSIGGRGKRATAAR